MAKKRQHKPKNSLRVEVKPPPIIFVPDKTYMDATGDVIPTDVILVADPIVYQQIETLLDVWDQEQKRGIIVA